MPGIIAENHPRKISDNTEKLNHEEEKAMEALFQAVNVICGKIQIVSNLFWDFPTNFDWYANIPILGNFSLAIILLVGTGIYFTFRLRFIQVRKFRTPCPDETEEQRHRNLIPGVIPLVDGHACRPRKYLRRHRRDLHRRSGRPALDVDLRLLWYVHSFR